MSQNNKALTFSLFDIERAISQNAYTTFEKYIIDFFEFVEHRNNIESTLHTDINGKTVCSHKGLVPFNNQITLKEKEDLYSRLAATITAYLSNSNYTPPNDFLIRFVLYKTHITNIFYLSCYGNMDHILFNKNLLDETTSLTLKTEQDIKLLYVCHSLNSRIQFDPEQLLNAIPNWGMYWYLGLLYGYHHSYNQQFEDNLNIIVDAHSLIQTMVFDATSVELSCSPWMLCSYLDRSDRHEIKKSINIAIENWVGKQVRPGVKKRISNYINNTKSIKRIVVLSEKYRSNHAMYRSYHKSIMELREQHHVTLVSAKNEYDDLSSKDFDQIIHIKDTAENIAEIVNEIIKLEPDLILYPSIGMAKWSIPLCNLRLAKYQIMSYGHPASAFSKYIDFGVTSGFPEGPDYQSFLREELFITSADTNMTRVPQYKSVEKKINGDGIVRVAINSSIPKITQRFLNLCVLLKQHSTLPIEFHFFLIQVNTAFEKSLNDRLGSQAIIHQPKPYTEYMETLSHCDLAIGTFPFGGANTNIDLALLGIPKIFYTEGSDLASYADICINQKLNPPHILHASSETDFLTNAIYLIHDSVERTRISEEIKSKDLNDLFFNQKDDKQNHMFIDAIKHFAGSDDL